MAEEPATQSSLPSRILQVSKYEWANLIIYILNLMFIIWYYIFLIHLLYFFIAFTPLWLYFISLYLYGSGTPGPLTLTSTPTSEFLSSCMRWKYFFHFYHPNIKQFSNNVGLHNSLLMMALKSRNTVSRVLTVVLFTCICILY